MDFGKDAKSIAEQLDERGISYSETVIAICDESAQDITDLLRRDLLTENQAQRAREKLMQQVRDSLILI